MAEVPEQRQRRDEQERQGREERQPVRRLDRAHVEDALQRREDERAGDQPGEVRVTGR